MYCETSCKEGLNVDMAFDLITKDIINKQNNNKICEEKDFSHIGGKEKKREKEIMCC